jgi:hypothetical protein
VFFPFLLLPSSVPRTYCDRAEKHARPHCAHRGVGMRYAIWRTDC